MSEGDDRRDGSRPLGELARGFRKRTWVTTRLLGKLGVRMAKQGLGLEGSPDDVDEDAAIEAAEALLEQLDGLKGLSMKIGQMVSYLDTMLPPKAQRILARLQFESRPVEWKVISEVLRTELGEPDSVFETIENTPFAAASIGQVHRAELDGTPVAVKIQYPEIERLVEADIKTIRRLSRLLLAITPLDGQGLIDELSGRVVEECNYANEARNQTRFARFLSDDDDVSVPAVHSRASSRRVLTTTFVEAMDFYTFRDTVPSEVKNRAAASIYRACFTCIFGHHAYNADPHPGNYLFDEEGHVTLLDFGCVKYFSSEFIANWKRIARSILDDDLSAFREAWTDAGFVWRERSFDWEHQLAAMRVLYSPMLSKTPFTFTHAFTRRVSDALARRNKNKLESKMAPDWLFVNRLQLGMFSVLAHLEATADWGRVFRRALGTRLQAGAGARAEDREPARRRRRGCRFQRTGSRVQRTGLRRWLADERRSGRVSVCGLSQWGSLQRWRCHRATPSAHQSARL